MEDWSILKIQREILWKAVSLGVASFVAFVLVTDAYAGDADWEKADCNDVPVRISHPEFPSEGFACVKAREGYSPDLDEKAIWQLTDSRFLYVNWTRKLGDNLFKIPSDQKLKGDLKIANKWARHVSSNWTVSEKYRDGKYLKFLVGKRSGAERNCFGHMSHAGKMGAGYKHRYVVIYCGLGRSHLSSEDVQTVLDYIVVEHD